MLIITCTHSHDQTMLCQWCLHLFWKFYFIDCNFYYIFRKMFQYQSQVLEVRSNVLHCVNIIILDTFMEEKKWQSERFSLEEGQMNNKTSIEYPLYRAKGNYCIVSI